jgi:hypothetical protein
VHPLRELLVGQAAVGDESLKQFGVELVDTHPLMFRHIREYTCLPEGNWPVVRLTPCLWGRDPLDHGAMLVIALKLLLSPALVLGGSAAQRKWGQAVGGRIVGLPLTSLPLLFLVALTQGTHFAALAATATLAGVSAQAVLTWAYAKTARDHGPVPATILSIVAFAVVATGADLLPLGAMAGATLATAVLALTLARWPVPSAERGREPGPRRDSTVLRMVLAGIFAVAVSAVAGPLGPRLAGLLTALPILSIVMFALTQRDDGTAAVQVFAHGVARGTYSVVAALLALALVLPTGHVTLAFAAAILASLAAQTLSSAAARLPALVGAH